MFLLGVDPRKTQTTAAEQELLRRWAAGKRRLVEIGVYEGYTTDRLAQAMARNGELFAIDPFLPGRFGICWGKWIARRAISRAGVADRVRVVEQYSFDAAEQISGEFDFIFVDGDHSLDGIRRDWNDWSSRVEMGGVIALHDSIVPPHNPAVAELGSCKFFESEVRHDNRFKIVDQVDSLSVLQRTA